MKKWKCVLLSFFLMVCITNLAPVESNIGKEIRKGIDIPTLEEVKYAKFLELEEKERVRKQLHELFIIESIIEIESNGNPHALNVKENAVGLFQIRRIMVREVNRLLGKKVYQMKDRKDPVKAKEMFLIVQRFYNPNMNLEIASRTWQGGMRGMKKKSTIKYYNKVKSIYERKIKEHEKQSNNILYRT